VTELWYSFTFSQVKKRYEKTQAQVRRAGEVNPKADDAELVVSSE